MKRSKTGNVITFLAAAKGKPLKRNIGLKQRLSSEEQKAFNAIYADPRFRAEARVLKAGITKLHKVYMAMAKKNAEAVKIAWDANR